MWLTKLIKFIHRPALQQNYASNLNSFKKCCAPIVQTNEEIVYPSIASEFNSNVPTTVKSNYLEEANVDGCKNNANVSVSKAVSTRVSGFLKPKANPFSHNIFGNFSPIPIAMMNLAVVRMYSSNKGRKIEMLDINMDVEDDDDDDEFGEEDTMCLPSKYFPNPKECPMTPIDIDPWEDEEESKQGTVYLKPYAENPYEYPPPPLNRTGEYKFRGITVVLPKSWLNPKLYRYRFDKKDKEELADDIRVIKFPK